MANGALYYEKYSPLFGIRPPLTSPRPRSSNESLAMYPTRPAVPPRHGSGAPMHSGRALPTPPGVAFSMHPCPAPPGLPGAPPSVMPTCPAPPFPLGTVPQVSLGFSQPPPAQQPPSPLPLPPWLQALLSPPSPGVGSFWKPENVRAHLKELLQNLDLLKSMKKELQMLILMKESDCSVDVKYDGGVKEFSEALSAKRISLEAQGSVSLEVARSLSLKLKEQLHPLDVVTNQDGPWKERSEAIRLAQKLQKYNRNKKWKKKKRRRCAEMRQKEHELFVKLDREADEWRAKEITKDAAQCKMEKMKEIAKLKAKEEKEKLEEELELVLVVERLQELRSIRVKKLKKQGHFLPEEDNEFLERVKAAVEEEERQAAAAADTDAAKDAIASAEESRRHIQSLGNATCDAKCNNEAKTNSDQLKETADGNASVPAPSELKHSATEDKVQAEVHDSTSDLPLDFYHYYHGSNYDMGTLLEVRRRWDAFIQPGGSRIPGHWVQPPPPANEVWASYLVSSRK